MIVAGARCEASLRLQEPGVVCGLAVAQAAFRELDPGLVFEARGADGDRLQPCELALIAGDARAILAGERLALNLLGRLSGIATLTRRYVDEIAGTQAVILDTRKTTPGLRALEKEAVRTGGGSNHRFGLYDGILIKDNHLGLAGGIRQAVAQAAARAHGRGRVRHADQLHEALQAGADRVLLDNMRPPQLARAVALAGGRGGAGGLRWHHIDTVRAVAETGVGYISIGALTHSARSLDVSLKVLT